MDEVARLRRTAILGLIASLALGAWGAFQLVPLEQHGAGSVRVHWLIGLLYEHLGFWPAVLVFPLLGGFACASIYRKIARLRAQEARR
jgi:hypothetical protein